MGLRDLAGDMARGTAGVWRGIAEALDPSETDTRADLGETAAGSRATDAGADSAGLGPLDVDESGREDGADGTGGMLVPIDTWTRILEQLGHLHEAGRDLADARERAAKAETENRFLREQLADLRQRSGPSDGSGTTRSAQALWARRPWSRDPDATRSGHG